MNATAAANGSNRRHGRSQRRPVVGSQSLIDQARTELYRGQCNCALLARRVRRRLSAASAQRGLQALDRGRQPARRGRGRGLAEATSLGRADRRTTTIRRPAGSAAGQQSAGGAGRPVARRAYVRARRAIDLPQSAGHAHPPRRGLPLQGSGRRIGSRRRGRQHPRSGGVQAGRSRSAAAVRSLSPQES